VVSKLLFANIFLNKYVKLGSENMRVYYHRLILFIIYLLSWTCKSSKSSKQFENSLPFFFFYLFFFWIYIYFYFVFII